jgi:raffinose/stachyose/melibiose transport system substrate-binding protein
MTRKIFNLLSLVLIVAFALSACSPAATPTAEVQPTEAGAEPTEASTDGEKVTVTWWHISTGDTHKALFQKFADDYMAANPNVNIEIQVLENEAFKTKLTTVMQSGEPPDVFQSWGGGVMNEYANAGLLQDITPALDADGGAWRASFSPGALGVYAHQGKNYGVPWDMGMVGFWYNKALFAQAGITAPPATWTELLDAVKKLKAAGITPIALGEGDKWPGAFWWEYLAVRIGGQAAFDAAQSRSGAFTDAAFVQAGEKIQELVALEPFQDGFLGATYGDQSTAVGNGKAAMELMGQWAPGVQKDNSANKEGLGDDLGWFPFPTVEGGAGAATDALGGGNGFGIGKNASAEAIDFVKYLSAPEQQAELAKLGVALPVVKGGESGLSDPNLLTVQKGASAAGYFQLYYDQYLPPATGSVVNDSVQGVFAGTLTPEQAAQAIEDSAAQEIK